MNKTRRCAGRLHECNVKCKMKCKNKFTIKKVLFQPIMNFPPKFFRAYSIPSIAIKRSTKVQKVSRLRGLREEPSCVTFRIRSKTADTIQIYITDKQVPYFLWELIKINKTKINTKNAETPRSP